MESKRYPNIGEQVFEDTLPNGLRLRVVPKPGFASCYAVLAADYTVRCIELTQGDPAHWYGVKFELALPEFIRMLEH